MVAGDFCVKLHLENKLDAFMRTLVIVYGAAQDNFKPDFLVELVRICDKEELPMLVGGWLQYYPATRGEK